MSASGAQQPVRRALRLLFLLQGQSFDGLRLKQLADALGASAPTVLRDLQVLAEEGIAERVPGRDEYWRLTPRIVQIAVAHQDEVHRLQQRVGEFNQRYTAKP